MDQEEVKNVHIGGWEIMRPENEKVCQNNAKEHGKNQGVEEKPSVK